MNHYYRSNRAWSDRFLPDIKRIVGAHLLNAAPDQYDWNEATDLMMLDARDLRVAARVRRPGYAHRFPHQFTLRSRSRTGAKTELAKIVEGHGDWMFYGNASGAGVGLSQWWLLDLNAFRAALIRQATNGARVVWGDRDNPDGTGFKWFDIRSFPQEPPLVVASHVPVLG